MRGRARVAAALAGAAALGGGAFLAVAAAGGGDDDAPLEGAARERAVAAALAHLGGGVVLEAEAGDDGAAYEVEVRRPGGSVAEVALDARFAVLGAAADDDAPGDDDGDDDAREAAAPVFSRPAAISNPYLPLSRFRRCVLEGTVDGVRERTVRVRLRRTERLVVGGRPVRALVVLDRAYEDGALVERTLDYYAQADDGTVHYLGEDVDEIEDGRVTGHEGSWRVGRDTPTPGVAMPARPRVGDTWRFEDVPGITVEDDEVVGRRARVRLGGRAYRDVIAVRERSRPGGVEVKLYARGVGEIRAVEAGGAGRVDLAGCR